MRAAVYHGRRDVRVQQWPAPADPGPGDVQLAVSLAGICGTDLEEFLTGPHLLPMKPHAVTGQTLPLVLGHEIVGTVVAVGPDVTALSTGDRVACGSGVWCDDCSWCRDGRTNLCANYYTIGLHADGGLAELVNVPAKACVPVDGLTDEAAVLAQPLAVALHAVRGCDTRPDEPVAVIGCGGIGLLAVAALAASGRPVLAVDVVAARLVAAARLGARRTIDARTDEAIDILRAETDGLGPGAVMECTGTVAGLRTATWAVRRGGLIHLVGLHRDSAGLDLTRLVLDEVRIATAKVHVCREDLPAAVAMLRSVPAMAEVLAEVAIPLDRLVPDGLAAMEGQLTTGRVIVRV